MSDVDYPQHVEIRDAFGNWHRAAALSGIEGTHRDGRKIHDFPVIWVTTVEMVGRGASPIPWPADDVRPAPLAQPDDFEWLAST